MPTLAEFKALGIITIICGMFFAGYHLRGIVDTARQEKQERADVVAASNKLLQENTIDEGYDRYVATTEDFQDKSNQVLNNETDKHNCTIPANWLHILQANSRH